MGIRRVMIFIDGRNLFYSARDYGDEGVEIDILELRKQLSDEQELIRGYWYDSVRPDSSDARQRFFDFLRTNGFRVVTSESKGSDGDYEEKGSDIKLASEMLHLAHLDAYDTAILVSGDGDFSGAVRKVQDIGKVVNVASFEEYLSNDLNKASDTTIELDDLVSQIRMDDTDEETESKMEQDFFLEVEEQE